MVFSIIHNYFPELLKSEKFVIFSEKFAPGIYLLVIIAGSITMDVNSPAL